MQVNSEKKRTGIMTLEKYYCNEVKSFPSIHHSKICRLRKPITILRLKISTDFNGAWIIESFSDNEKTTANGVSAIISRSEDQTNEGIALQFDKFSDYVNIGINPKNENTGKIKKVIVNNLL
eukprot:snap_masked-scaffold_4-processed-gene-21.22-mRNA-1 protein AED:1.00 eAED:1.00 QI:0/0/0/0/1/1/2/0/121